MEEEEEVSSPKSSCPVVILLCGDVQRCETFYEDLSRASEDGKCCVLTTDYPSTIWTSVRGNELWHPIVEERLDEIDRQRRETKGQDYWVRYIFSKGVNGFYANVTCPVVIRATPVKDIPHYYSIVQRVIVVDLREKDNARVAFEGNPQDLSFDGCRVVSGNDEQVIRAIFDSVISLYPSDGHRPSLDFSYDIWIPYR